VANDPLESEQNSILSVKILTELRDLGVLHEIVNEFLIEVRMRIDEIRQASADKRFDALTLQAHALKGASGAVGALRLSKISAKVESAARLRSDALQRTLVEELAAEVDLANHALQQLLVDEPESAPQ
jgi:HPt (histidine-containing phosphotransfer) domain-containing protein